MVPTIDMCALVEARRKAALQRAIWSHCCDLACKEGLTTDKAMAYERALTTITQAYSVSCELVRKLEGI